jgi:hypothetical protein
MVYIGAILNVYVKNKHIDDPTGLFAHHDDMKKARPAGQGQKKR